MQLAGIKTTGLNNISKSYTKLVEWAAPKGLMSNTPIKMVTIYYDSARTTAFDSVRACACIVLKKPLAINEKVAMITMDPKKCIVAAMEIGMDEFEKSWTDLYVWMNDNNYRPSNENPFEIYHNNYQEHPGKKCLVDFHIPIE